MKDEVLAPTFKASPISGADLSLALSVKPPHPPNAVVVICEWRRPRLAFTLDRAHRLRA